MVLKDIVSFLMCTIVVLGDSVFVDHLGRCSIHDSECHRKLFENVLHNTGKDGISVLDIPPTDPYYVKNVSVSILGLVNITLVDGTVKGIKDCVIDSFSTHIEEEYAAMEMTCNIVIKGQYKISPSKNLLTTVLGQGIVHGKGHGKVKLDKLHLKFDLYFDVVQDKAGEIYFKCKHDDLKYTYDVLGKTTFAADNIFLSNQDITKEAVGMLNKYSSFVMKTFGKDFINKAMEYIHLYLRKFFDGVPAKYYITEDLTSYVAH